MIKRFNFLPYANNTFVIVPMFFWIDSYYWKIGTTTYNLGETFNSELEKHG